MNNWQILEEESYVYLKSNYESSEINFIQCGASDSTQSDILVKKNNKNFFYIDVKSPESQSGQFVLFPNDLTQEFEYSKNNKTQLNIYSKKIIDFLNKNYGHYSTPGTRGENIHMNKTVFYDWIIDYYLSKNVKYIITKNNNFILFPIERLSHYFDVSAKLRRKKSGSGNPSLANQEEIKTILTKNGYNFQSYSRNKSFYISSKHDFHQFKVSGEKYSFLLKKSSENVFQVRRLSNTSNMNVIFSLSLISDQSPKDLLKFEILLNQ
ncbi:hypothetical protein ACTQ5X_06610 [Jeotgalibaca porci]|uniref:hypothetical protein n=1 Tax=Jeotgalibaca porci TaxID=1868793 RepID=UPI003F9125EF